MRRLIPVIAASALVSCGDPASPASAGRVSYSLINASAPLTGTVGELLPVALEVQAMREFEPAPGQVVTFAVTDPLCGHPLVESLTTNAAGRVRANWVLGTTARTCEMEVRALDQETGAPRLPGTFTAEVQPGPAAFIAMYSIAHVFPATVFLDDVLPLSWFVRSVEDIHHNPITDYSVTARVLSGRGTIVDDALVGGSTEGVGEIEVTALGLTVAMRYSIARDLRTDAWRLEATCADEQSIDGTTYRTSRYDLAVESVAYDRSFTAGTVATLHLSGTVAVTALASEGGQTTTLPVNWLGTVKSQGREGEVRLSVQQSTPANGRILHFVFTQLRDNPDRYEDFSGTCQGSASLVATPAS